MGEVMGAMDFYDTQEKTTYLMLWEACSQHESIPHPGI